MRIRWMIAAVAALGLVLAACGDDSGDSSATTTSGESTTAAGNETTTSGGLTSSDVLDVKVEDNADLGDILATQDGFTLYVFMPDDGAGSATCTEACADTWPPLLSNEGEAPEPLAVADFSTTDNGGTDQVVFMGWPLYRYSGDSAPGDTNGQGLAGQWYVMSPSGPVQG